ncbi:enterobactin synthetase component D [Duganella sp. CF458]|uniref:4'-phosphopantetheinyl transferase family protein n=1 Tax=Duganella sp. CF458 TaxID=1884368 RepID=UPI0008F1A188|nr:4'-phosphopantetheinyl transferase superfamily protein [Duganella sp. CF458]SFH02422.1 enterobactin synthetase component D [Duganella sp. CF458]
MFIDIDLPGAPDPAPPVRIFLQQFNCASFDDASFARHDIHCPENIQRSVVKRRAEYFHGRLCAQRALAALGHTGVQVLSGGSREPLWPAGIRGSITHSDAMAAAAVVPAAQCRGLGIDIASPIGQDAWKDVVGIAVSEQEYRLLAAMPAELNMASYLALVFSAKESYFKALFDEVRCFFDFDALAFSGIDLERKLLRLTVTGQVSPALPVGAHCMMPYRQLPEGDVLTVFSWR